MRWLHDVGIALGSGEGKGVGSTVGPKVGNGEGRSVGSIEGTEDGIFVGPGEGIGLGSGVGLQSILSCGSKHLSGQQAQFVPLGKGKVLQIVFPTEAQLAGGSSSQHATGHSSIKWLQDVGNALGTGVGSSVGPLEGTWDGLEDGAGEGSGVGLQSSLSRAP